MAKYLYLKNHASLWLDKEFFLGANTTGLWRIMWGNPDKIILNFYLPLPELVQKLFNAESFSLDMLNYESGRVDSRESGEVIFTFENCKLQHRWMPTPIPLGFEIGGNAIICFVYLQNSGA